MPCLMNDVISLVNERNVEDDDLQFAFEDALYSDMYTPSIPPHNVDLTIPNLNTPEVNLTFPDSIDLNITSIDLNGMSRYGRSWKVTQRYTPMSFLRDV